MKKKMTPELWEEKWQREEAEERDEMHERLRQEDIRRGREYRGRCMLSAFAMRLPELIIFIIIALASVVVMDKVSVAIYGERGECGRIEDEKL
jgi:hypothetical protein